VFSPAKPQPTVKTVVISMIPPSAARKSLMISNRTVTVFGAYGQTGRFVVSELYQRGWTPIFSGRDAAKLDAVPDAHPESEVRLASVDDSASLDRAIAGASAVINCAGPFVDTAAPIIDAALRSGIHYLDVAAEQAAVLSVFERFTHAAPAMAFYGGWGISLRPKPWESGLPQMKSS
jgi:short subunit dehydrogenase-like uncharacterized protein